MTHEHRDNRGFLNDIDANLGVLQPLESPLILFGDLDRRGVNANQNPYSKRMRLHCDKYIKASEAWQQKRTHLPRFMTSG